jgi:hypothetical protein
MVEKTTWSIRLPNDVSEELMEFKRENDITKTDAGKRVIIKGLEAIEEERQEPDPEEIEVPSRLESWCQERMEDWAGIALLSTVGFFVTFLLYIPVVFNAVPLPETWFHILALVFIVGGVVFGGGAIVLAVVIRTGLAERGVLQAAGGDTQGAPR